MIKLERIDENNYWECLGLKVAESQKKFVSENVLAMAKAFIYKGTSIPLAIYNDRIMVGFILLRFSGDIKNYFIWHFMIDEKYQGKEYGTEALKQVIQWIREQGNADNITTTYILGNDRVKKLYEKMGFVYWDEMEGKEVDMILYL